jgi:Uma2 family endonuclease
MARPVPASIPPGPFKLTVDEYMELPNDGKRYQILDGELDVTPAPRTRHQKILGRMFFILKEALDLKGQGDVYIAPTDVILDDFNVVQPDLLFVRKDRRHIIGDDNIKGVPDLIVEVFSPSTRRTDVLVKSRIYERFGVPSYWTVDPDIDRMELFRLEGPAYVLAAAGSSPDVLRPAEFQGLELPLAEVFKK